MRPGLAGRLSRVLVGWHPRRWRERYGEEMLGVLDQHQASTRTVLNLAASVLSTHADPAYRTEVLSLPRLRRAALISAAITAPIVLCSATGPGTSAGSCRAPGAWVAWRSRPASTCWSVPSGERARTAWTPCGT